MRSTARSARIIAIALGCFATSVVNGDQETVLQNANQAFHDGRFQEAIDNYTTLLESGRSNAALFYDLGNAWFRLGNLGKAILNYERALALDPRVGLFLPCRVTVVERDGKVLVMSINPKRLSHLFNNAELDRACEEMFQVYSDILEEATL